METPRLCEFCGAQVISEVNYIVPVAGTVVETKVGYPEGRLRVDIIENQKIINLRIPICEDCKGVIGLFISEFKLFHEQQKQTQNESEE